MKRILIAASALLALAACSGEGGNGSAPAAPVAAAPAPAGQSWTETVVATSEGFRMGNPNAPIKLVEYGARTCPTCGAFSREAAAPLENNYVASGKVSFEFRDFLVHGAPDLAAAALGQCGGAGPFFPILDQMFANQTTYLDRLQDAPASFQQQVQAAGPAKALTLIAEQMGLIEFVKQRGVTEARARACLSDQARLDALAKNTQDTMAAEKVTGTPTFFINDQPVPNTATWEQLEKALKAAGA